jgi:alkylhydroperoxidase family enzyme
VGGGTDKESRLPIIPQIDYDRAPEDVKRAHDEHLKMHGRVTNMKRTLLHSVPAFNVYMEWYTLAAEVEKFIGKRGVYVFSWAISAQNDCLICTMFFRKILKDQGDNPDNLVLGAREQLLVDFGRALTTAPHAIPESIYTRLKAAFSETEILQLTAFAGIMVATNLINTVLKVDLDDYLQGY